MVALIALVFVERRVPSPSVDFSLLRNRVFASANVSLILSFLALFAVSFLLPFYLEELRGFSSRGGGAAADAAAADDCGGRAMEWRAGGSHRHALAGCGGLALACVGLVLISQLGTAQHGTGYHLAALIIGFGQGLFQSPNNSALLGSAPRERQGTASGFLATGRVMGQSVSVALAGAIFAGAGAAMAGSELVAIQSGRRAGPVQIAVLQQTFVAGFHDAFVVCAAVAAIGVLTSLVRGSERTGKAGG